MPDTPRAPQTPGLFGPARLFAPFRLVAMVEGITTLALFVVAMPLKYLMGDPSWVTVTGTLHGYAWIAYMVMLGLVMRGPGWGSGDAWRAAMAGLFPFGTFLNDAHLRRRGAEVFG